MMSLTMSSARIRSRQSFYAENDSTSKSKWLPSSKIILSWLRRMDKGSRSSHKHQCSSRLLRARKFPQENMHPLMRQLMQQPHKLELTKRRAGRRKSLLRMTCKTRCVAPFQWSTWTTKTSSSSSIWALLSLFCSCSLMHTSTLTPKEVSWRQHRLFDKWVQWMISLLLG